MPTHASQVQQLEAAFGAQRLMWGSDFPFVVQVNGRLPPSRSHCVSTRLVSHCVSLAPPPSIAAQECGYVDAARTLSELRVLSDEQQQWVMGGTLASLFPGGWES